MTFLIIGAGIGGLSLAALLAKEGRKVKVIEKNNQPGGRARVYRKDGFVFDMGPSWYIMPDVFDKYFNDIGIKREELYELVRLDPSYRIFFKDSEPILVSADLKKNMELFDGFEPDGGKKLGDYLGRAARDYRIAVDELLMRDYDKLRNIIDGKLIKEGLKLPLFGNIDDYISRVFKSEEARRVLEYSIGFVGGSPMNTPSIYYIMNHVDLNMGVWYPMGGIGVVIEKLYEYCTEHGVEFCFEEEATNIITENNNAIGVKTTKGIHEAESVIVTTDYPHSELELVEEKDRSYDKKYWDNRLFAPSALVIYVGLDRKLKGLEHHNLYLAGDWGMSFDTLYDVTDPEWPANISYYVNLTSKTDPSMAPEDGETVFILVPVPDDFNDTPEIREKLYNQIMTHIENVSGEKLLGYEKVKRIFGPEDFIRDYNAYKGTSLGLVHTLNQSAIFRPSHRSKKIKNLYYNGHYTHPGIGLPLVLISSQILAKNLLKK